MTRKATEYVGIENVEKCRKSSRKVFSWALALHVLPNMTIETNVVSASIIKLIETAKM